MCRKPDFSLDKRIFSDEEAQEYSETDETPVPWDDFAPILEFLEYDLVNDRLSEYIQVNTDLKLDGDITGKGKKCGKEID